MVAETKERLPVQLSRKKQAVFAFVIFIVFLCMLEGALILLDLPPTLRQDGGLMYRTDNAIGFEHTPGWSGYHAGAMLHTNIKAPGF